MPRSHSVAAASLRAPVPGAPGQRPPVRGTCVLAAPLLAALVLLAPVAAPAATDVVFVSGAFRRSIPVSDLEHLASTGQARGLLADLLRFGRQPPAQVASLLNLSIPLPLVGTSRLLHTQAGTAILTRVGMILFPLRAPAQALPALRAATINGLARSNGTITPVGFLRAYPSRELAVSLPALRSALTQVEAMSGVVKGFLDTDLKPKLK